MSIRGGPADERESDAADRRRCEAALIETERRLRTVTDNADIVLWAVDENGVFTLSEGRGLRALGLSPGEVVGRSVFELYADHPQILADVGRALRGEAGTGLVEVEGTIFESRYLPLPRGGSAGGAIGVAIDITERERAAEALRESEERFREIAEHIREVFWLFDCREGRTVYVSPAWEAIWGRSADDLYASHRHWSDSIHPNDRPLVRQAFRQIVRGGGGEVVEYRILRPDGATRWISDRGFAVPDAAGRVVRVAGIAEDVTERKRADEERRRLEAGIQHAQKLESLGVLAGGIAHDFNNLLMGVLGNADLALQDLAPGSPGRACVERIRTAAQRASELTGQMLAYSGKGHFVVRPLDLNELVRETSHLIEAAISKKAESVLDLYPAIPAIAADAGQVRQVAMNLITNASEAIDGDRGVIHVRTGLVEADEPYLAGCIPANGLEPGPYVFLEVSDTGCGMDRRTQSRIFDPFFTTKFTGRGLGLAAVLGIIRGHRAAIRVDSEVDIGTTMTVLFPAADAVPAARPRPRPEAEAPGAGATVLVVDDEPTVRLVCHRMLERAGFRVLIAEDGERAVALLREHADEVAVVLLDLTMPRFDGQEALRLMREIRPDVRVVLSSGYSEQEALRRFDKADLAGFLQKPFSSTELQDEIRKALRGGNRGQVPS